MFVFEFKYIIFSTCFYHWAVLELVSSLRFLALCVRACARFLRVYGMASHKLHQHTHTSNGDKMNEKIDFTFASLIRTCAKSEYKFYYVVISRETSLLFSSHLASTIRESKMIAIIQFVVVFSFLNVFWTCSIGWMLSAESEYSDTCIVILPLLRLLPLCWDLLL